MTARRLVMVGIVLGGFAGVAGAEGNVNWDGRYEPGSSGGTEKCPAASEAVVVSGGRFSFPWNVKLDRTYRIGTIAGSVRPSGRAVFKATVADPLPADARVALAVRDVERHRRHARLHVRERRLLRVATVDA